jgi:predicted TIM-barrel fold metal-dependent hydrolase
MTLQIGEWQFHAIDAHTHLGRRKTPLGHGVASYLGDDLVRNLDEAGLDCAVAFPLGASYTDYSDANRIMAEEMAKYPKRIISFCRINPNFGPEKQRNLWTTAWGRSSSKASSCIRKSNFSTRTRRR